MKYVIISLQSGRVITEGPLLLIKANPIKDKNDVSGNKLPAKLHEESKETTNFAYKISVNLIDIFIKALEDSKKEIQFWEPNMEDYILERITDFDGKEVLAYKHKSLRFKQTPNPKEILPQYFEQPQNQRYKESAIKKREIDNFNTYVKSGMNSFDYMLRDYDKRKKLFAYPVLVSQNFDSVLDRSRFSIFRDNGFYLRNDIIQSVNEGLSNLKHSLLCCGYNRYFTSYSVQEEFGINYRFYSKEASHLIFNLFNEIAYPIPFESNKLIQIYEKDNYLGITKSVYDECKIEEIKEEDIIGFVSCDVKEFDGSTETILYILTYDPIKKTRATRYNLFDSEYHKVYIESKYLKTNSLKIITWAFIYELQKKAGIESGELAINDAEKCKTLQNYIASNYNSMSDNEKDMCAYIIPENYKLTIQEKVQENCLRNYVVNMGTLVRKNGLVFGASLPFFDESVHKQVDEVIKIIDKRKKYFLNTQIDYKIDAALILIIINLNVEGPLKKIIGLWAFYHLLNIKKEDNSPLVSEMILLIYKNNQKMFMDLINRIKSKVLIEYRDNNSFFGPRSIEDRFSWSLYDDMYCYFELFYEYSNNGKGYQLNDFEKEFFCNKFIKELELDCIDNYFRNYPSVNHTTRNIEKQRLFFRNELEKYIKERIDNKDFIFKDIIM